MRALAFVLLSLSPAIASAQVRSVPVEAGRAPVAAPLFAPSLPSLNGPSLTLSLSAPSLTPSIAPALTPNALAEPVALALPLALTPAIPIAQALPVATPLSVKPSARMTLTSSLAAISDRSAASSRGTPQDFSALFDGTLAREPLTAASTNDENPPEALKPALTPKEVRRAKIALAISVPAAAGLAIGGALAPHLVLAGVHLLGQASYWLANPFAFAFTLPQIYRMLRGRSADVSKAMLAVGFLSTVAMAVNMAFDGKDLMLYRNLAQAAGFGVMLFLQRRFTRKTDAPAPSKKKVWVQTALAVLAMGALMAITGPLLSAFVPGIAAMSALLVPFQIVAGFGFTYLMYAQLTKMQREHSAGDSSPAMMWAYLGTKTIWVWSFAMMMSLVTGAPWLALSVGALFIGTCWFAGQAALSRLLHAPWAFLPEKKSFLGRTLTKDHMADAIAFAGLSTVILLLAGLGWLAFGAFIGVPAASSSRFLMYLLYTVQSLVACLATMRTLRMRKDLDKK